VCLLRWIRAGREEVDKTESITTACPLPFNAKNVVVGREHDRVILCATIACRIIRRVEFEVVCKGEVVAGFENSALLRPFDWFVVVLFGEG